MQPVFPATYSTLSSSALADLVIKKYGMAEVSCAFFLRGVGDTYMLTIPGKRYVLRVYRSDQRSLPQINAEMELLVALAAAAVRVSVPVADLSGHFVQEINAAEGPRYAVVFTYASGAPATLLTERHLAAIGRQMARFHNVSSVVGLSDPRWSFDMNTTIDRPLQQVKYAYSGDPEGFAWLEKTAQQVKKGLEAIDTTAFPMGWCHYDLLPKNFHFSDEDSLTLFDFDFFGYGWLVNDVMTFWQHLSLDVVMGRLTQEAADESFGIMVRAYREYRPLSDGELSVIPLLGFGWWVFYLGFYTTHDQFFPQLHDVPLKRRTDLIRQLTERYLR